MIARSNLKTGGALRALSRLSLAFLVACATGNGVDASSTTTTTTTTTTITTRRQVTTTPVSAGCAEGAGFIDAGRVMRVDQPASDTNTLGLVSWQSVEGCERFTIRFETTEGAPATTPPTVVVDFLDSRQVLRVWTDAGSTVVTDQLVETALVDRLFVVRGLDGGMFIDLHLNAPAQARARVSNSPAQITVELEPGVEAFGSTASTAPNVVVLTPVGGVEIPAVPTVDVTGYARVFEATVVVVARVGDETVDETTVTAADWSETWGEFVVPIHLPRGEVSLFVGEQSLANGEPVGVTVNLTVR